MDMLDELLAHEGEVARDSLLRLVGSEGPGLRELAFNTFEVTFDADESEVRIWDVLDGDKDPQVLDVNTFEQRLR